MPLISSNNLQQSVRKVFFIVISTFVLLCAYALVVSNVDASALPFAHQGTDFFGSDSTKKTELPLIKKDTVLVKSDTAKVYLLRDSTYLTQLTLTREQSPAAQAFTSANPFYLKSPPVVARIVQLDSTGRFVIIRETMNGKDIRIPIKMPLEEYVKQRSQNDFKQNFSDMVTKEDAGKKKKNDLGELLGSFTNIDIPVPANPVFSIFGPPRINLVISGAVDIRAAFRNTKTDEATISLLGNSRNEPDFAQEVQINVNGTIGDKLNIVADWNTQRTFEYENQLHIKYTGYEDEIVQSVEAGNVSLTTNSSFVSSSSALFGIKAAFQIGPLKLTAIASQKKGQIQEKTVSGGAQEQTFNIRAYQYSKDYFFVDTAYISTYETYVQNNQIVRPDLQIKQNEYEVWITNQDPTILTNRTATAFMMLPALDSTHYKNYKPSSVDPGTVEDGKWEMLVPDKDYRLNRDAGYITLNRSTEGQAVAIAYRIENGAGPNDDIFYGTLTKYANDSLLVLKLIKPRVIGPQFKTAWSLMLKNIYPLGGRKIQKTGFSLDIKYEIPGQDPVNTVDKYRWLQVFGFDEYNGDGGSKGHDGEFDYRAPINIDEDRGEIIFPTLRPFTDGISKAFAALKIAIPDTNYTYSIGTSNLYDTTVYAAQNASLKDRFSITGKITASSTNTINLGFNIVEGSVQVLLDGRPLVTNVDYTVDYIIGQVIIKNQAALVPGANLQVKYEQNDLFQLASKTLIGTRGEVKLSEKTQFGFTALNLNQQTLSDKVRLGEEPIDNSIYGFDGQTSGELPFLTKAIDALPLIDTKTKSEFTLRGEAAYMSPDPNTKKSTIPDDNGKGIAYIDDFEGAKRIIPLGVSYGLWHDMSPPEFQFNVGDSVNTFARQAYKIIADTTKIKSKAKTYWYNLINSVRVNDIYGFDASGKPIKSVARGQEFVSVLDINYNPLARGAYNYSDSLRKTLLADPTKNWGGVERVVSSTAVDLVRENINFIEVWVKVQKGTIDSTRKVFIDLGKISEDVIPNGKLDTEDGVGGTTINGILNDGEDVGIDGLTDAQEQVQHADFLKANAPYDASLPDPSGDPAGDDWVYSLSDFSRINGTENNKTSEIGRFPDTEDLNRNNFLDTRNDYYEYELNLDTTSANPLRVGGGNNGWYQYRIPINDFKNKIGSPDLSLIEFVRVWFTGFDKDVEISVVDFNLIGNQWEELKKNDTTFTLSVVNVEDNSLQGYTSPPGVQRERDRTKPDEQVYGNEQSLALNFFELKAGESREAIKRYSYRPLDVFSYREMKMFVHGDANSAKDPVNAFIRFGADSLNYYEYKTRIYPGWDVRNNIRIKFEDLTAIKQGRDSSNVRVTIPVKGGPAGATYAALGNPTLTRINYISVGVENPVKAGTTNTPITGQIWVNELRLTDVDDTPGWAYSVSTSVKLADLGSIAFTYSQVDPYFHSLENRFGSRMTSTNWNLSTSLAFEKFFPQEWNGTTFPFSYSHTEQFQKPKYLPSSDIVVTSAADQQKEFITKKTGSSQTGDQERERIITESQSLSTTDTYAMPSFKVNVPSDLWFVRDILNRIGYGFSYTTSSLRSPTVAFRTSWQWNARINYAYNFDPNYYLQPFDFLQGVPVLQEFRGTQLYYFPVSNIATGVSLNRSRSNERLRDQAQDSNPVRGLSASRNMQFGWKLTDNGLLNVSGDYSVDISSSMVHLELDRYGRQRDFQQILNQMFLQDQLVSFGYDNSYNQSFSVNTKPRVPAFFDLNKYVSLSARYSVGYRWQNSLQQGDLGIGTGWGNNISLTSDVSLKSFVDTWFPAAPASSNESSSSTPPPPTRSRGNRDDDSADSTVQKVEAPKIDSTVVPKRTNVGLIGIARMLIKTPFLDYDKINVSFTQTNSAQNNGVPGRPGFTNFFGRIPFVQQSDRKYGPSRAYQLGLVSVPSADITDIFVTGKFPFIGFSTDANKQLRAKGASITDAFSQNNKITFRTSRDLWAGARVDLNWNLGWDYSRSQSLHTDSAGHPILVSSATSGAIERSFMTLPPTFIFSMFKSGIEDVAKKYHSLYDNTSDTRSEDEKLAQAFEEGFESVPVLKKVFGQLLPRVNYSLRWDGLEQLGIFKNFATRVSLDHAYQSTYRRSFDGNIGGGEATRSQRISYGFSPLAGINFSFKELFKGTMSANVRYGTTTSYDLTPSAKNISESGTNDVAVTASFAKQGFEIPLFGLTLQNDIDISLSYSYSKNSKTTYDVKGKEFNTKGTPGEGSSRTQIEPRIKYVLSARVTASLFYRYTKVAPDAGGSRIPGTTTNEGGIDVHIAIQ
ncbi:MAG: cell surface protein SprA [Bacteroidota bacterium]|nr:cell surface protein SprA [Bacteroidota bacterium]